MNLNVSVIIPVYNEEKYIEKCLRSLSEQTYKPLEIIVADDGSSDKSKIKSQKSKVKLKIENFQLVGQEHLGAGQARNLGVKKASGDILVFVDADMTFAPDFVEKLVAPIIKGQTRGTFSKDEYVNNWKSVWARCWNYNLGIFDNKRIPKNYQNFAPVFRAILKKEFVKAGGFEAIGYTDDWSLSKKLGYQSTQAQDAVCFHQNPESLREVFRQARWIGKNEFIRRKKILSILRFNILSSFIAGLGKSFIYKEPRFMVFKFVYDLGIISGLVSSIISPVNLYK